MAVRVAYVFPGQGSQALGMGREFAMSSPAARQVFAIATSVVDMPLAALCEYGPVDVLRETEIAQPAIMAASLACFLGADEMEPLTAPAAIAGHSLGFLTALVAARALTIEVGIDLARRRGQLM